MSDEASEAAEQAEAADAAHGAHFHGETTMTFEELAGWLRAVAARGLGAKVHCTGDGGRTLIQEVRVNLQGAIAPETPVAGLILAADPFTTGCPKGVVDPSGLQ